MGFVPYRQNRPFVQVQAEPATTPTGINLWFRARILGTGMGGVTNAFEAGAALLSESVVGDALGLGIEQPGLYEFSAYLVTTVTANNLSLRITGSEDSPDEEFIWGDRVYPVSSAGIVIVPPVLIPITSDWLNETDSDYHKFCPWFNNLTGVSMTFSSGFMDLSYISLID